MTLSGTGAGALMVFGVRVQIRRVCGSPEGAVLCTAAKLDSDPNNPTQEPGSPFFSLGFFGEAKKSESPAAAIERHRNLAKRRPLITSKLSGRALPMRDRAFLGSEPKLPEPAARPAGASLRCAAKLGSDPKNQQALITPPPPAANPISAPADQTPDKSPAS